MARGQAPSAPPPAAETKSDAPPRRRKRQPVPTHLPAQVKEEVRRQRNRAAAQNLRNKNRQAESKLALEAAALETRHTQLSGTVAALEETQSKMREQLALLQQVMARAEEDAARATAASLPDALESEYHAPPPAKRARVVDGVAGDGGVGGVGLEEVQAREGLVQGQGDVKLGVSAMVEAGHTSPTATACAQQPEPAVFSPLPSELRQLLPLVLFLLSSLSPETSPAATSAPSTAAAQTSSAPSGPPPARRRRQAAMTPGQKAGQTPAIGQSSPLRATAVGVGVPPAQCLALPAALTLDLRSGSTVASISASTAALTTLASQAATETATKTASPALTLSSSSEGLASDVSGDLSPGAMTAATRATATAAFAQLLHAMTAQLATIATSAVAARAVSGSDSRSAATATLSPLVCA